MESLQLHPTMRSKTTVVNIEALQRIAVFKNFLATLRIGKLCEKSSFFVFIKSRKWLPVHRPHPFKKNNW